MLFFLARGRGLLVLSALVGAQVACGLAAPAATTVTPRPPAETAALVATPTTARSEGATTEPATASPPALVATDTQPALAQGVNQIVVAGALAKSYTPVDISLGRFGPTSMRLYMNEETPAGSSRTGDMLTVAFASDDAPGRYTFEDVYANPAAPTWATYGTVDGTPANFKSLDGTLTLTATGSSYSGGFEIALVDDTDPSRTLEVSGSFADIPSSP